MTAVITLTHVAMEFPALQGLGSVQALVPWKGKV